MLLELRLLLFYLHQHVPRWNFGHLFEKRLESLAPCYSQSFYWWIFKENQTLLWFLKYIKNRKTRQLVSIHEKHLLNGKMREANQTKIRVWEDSTLCPETSTKNAVHEFHLWIRNIDSNYKCVALARQKGLRAWTILIEWDTGKWRQ
jgi:hypothetical protein